MLQTRRYVPSPYDEAVRARLALRGVQLPKRCVTCGFELREPSRAVNGECGFCVKEREQRAA